MKKTRRNLFANRVLVFGISQFILCSAYASITKVGNGDDGADLEALSPITSGPIFESRKSALQLLKKLNVVGVPGLGLLIPEVERTDLMLATKDVHPTGEQQGSLEISDDQNLVYARTFAEPYAATRFFPAANKLSKEQLVALHVHEALHRALPVEIRTDENTVMHFTMAITSPGANFDRIKQVSAIYLASKSEKLAAEQNALTTETLASTLVLPEKSSTSLGYRIDSFSFGNNGFQSGTPVTFQRFEFITSLLDGYKAFRGYAIEPVLRVRLSILKQSTNETALGPASFDLETRTAIDSGAVAGPFLRFTTRSIDKLSPALDGNRDIFTLGGFYRTEREKSYLNSTFGYSLPSASSREYGVTAKYGSIFSLDFHTGFKWRGLLLGGMAEVHSIDGSAADDVRLVLMGPEIGYDLKPLQMRVFVKGVVNNRAGSLDDFGDIMDHGTGLDAIGSSLTFTW